MLHSLRAALGLRRVRFSLAGGIRRTAGRCELGPDIGAPCIDDGCIDHACIDHACIDEACIDEACIGTACIDDGCIDEACIGTACIDDGCIDEACIDEACIDEACIGTACIDDGCIDEACIDEACIGTAGLGCAPRTASLLLAALVAGTAACGTSHRAAPDAAPCDDPAGCDGTPDDAPLVCASVSADGRRLLSQMGLYADIASHTIAAGVTEFQPAYPLWTDGAVKRRFIALPAGGKIDTSNMDHWQFPVGTKLFKEFMLDGRRLETRVIERTASTGADTDYTLTAFVWTPDGCDAVETPLGATGVLGTTHDVPDRGQCLECHGGEAGRVLGFSAIQLATSGPEPTLASLAKAGVLTVAPPAGAKYDVPGPATTAAALGYLHGNCGHCHNPKGMSLPGTLSMNLRLNVADRTPEATTIWRTAVNKPTQLFRMPGVVQRIAGHDPDASAVLYRMTQRRSMTQMPSLGTKEIDAAGVATVRAWIASLSATPGS